MQDFERLSAAKDDQSEQNNGNHTPGFCVTPSSAAINLMQEVLTSGNDVDSLKDRKALVSNGADYEIFPAGEGRKISYKSDSEKVEISFESISKLAGNNKGVKKLLTLVLTLANEQAAHNGYLFKNYVSFTLVQLVELGMYSSIRSARTGFLNSADKLESMKLSVQAKSKKELSDPDAVKAAGGVLFTYHEINDGICYIYFNEQFNWKTILQYYMVIPPYYFSLSNRGADLLFYICYLARQNCDKIVETGHFCIGFRALQARLQLPHENDTNDPKRTIKDPIETAIEEIEEANHEYFGSAASEFNIFPVCDDKAPAGIFLDRGYLRVSFNGSLAKNFFSIAESKEKKIKQAANKKERIAEKAQAIKMAKAMEKASEEKASEQS